MNRRSTEHFINLKQVLQFIIYTLSVLEVHGFVMNEKIISNLAHKITTIRLSGKAKIKK